MPPFVVTGKEREGVPSVNKAKMRDSNGTQRVPPIIRRSPRPNAKSTSNGPV